MAGFISFDDATMAKHITTTKPKPHLPRNKSYLHRNENRHQITSNGPRMYKDDTKEQQRRLGILFVPFAPIYNDFVKLKFVSIQTIIKSRSLYRTEY